MQGGFITPLRIIFDVLPFINSRSNLTHAVLANPGVIFVTYWIVQLTWAHRLISCCWMHSPRSQETHADNTFWSPINEMSDQNAGKLFSLTFFLLEPLVDMFSSVAVLSVANRTSHRRLRRSINEPTSIQATDSGNHNFVSLYLDCATVRHLVLDALQLEHEKRSRCRMSSLWLSLRATKAVNCFCHEPTTVPLVHLFMYTEVGLRQTALVARMPCALGFVELHGQWFQPKQRTVGGITTTCVIISQMPSSLRSQHGGVDTCGQHAVAPLR
jgi:hypothetical protein